MQFPRRQWIEAGIDPRTLPDDDEVPEAVPDLYTTDMPGNLNLFDTLHLNADGTDLDIKLIAVGAHPQNPSLLYVLDPDTGQLLQLDANAVAVRGVNSNYRLFIATLQRILWALESTGSKDLRSVFTTGMRYTLSAVDDTAFEPGAWWPTVFKQFQQPTTH